MAPESPERWRSVESLLHRLLDMNDADQAALLHEVSSTDPDMGRELELLLRADRASGVLDEDIAGIAHALLPAEAAGVDLQPGDRVGPFRVLRVAGTGGMGDVYVAERVDGEFDQVVALKLVRGAAAGPAARRFLDERRIMAGLNHPGIARLLDGGVTAAGVPWFAMEYVEGEHLTRHCDARRLPVDARIRLFLDVCDAVSYAHRNLVVHRDLKPANILVTPDGQVKLLDFGIARVLEPGPGTDAVATMLLWLTPEYASPEQLSSAPVSTASDIYSLGVLLYELLCGQRPFQAETGRPHMLARAILEDDPRPPSTVIRGHATSTRHDIVASIRSTTPRRLLRRLRGDLDTIVLQALRREPDQRYRSADEMATDLRRCLDGRPVLARRGSRWYTVRRFVARNRTAVAAAAMPVVLAVLFGVFHTAAVTRERDLARQQADRAERISDFLVDLFDESDPLGVGVGPRPVSDFLAIGAARLSHELQDEPELRASMFRVVGRVYDNLGAHTEADSLLRAALGLRTALLPPDHLDLAQSVHDLGALRLREGKLPAADSLLTDALRRLPVTAPADRRAEFLDGIAELRRLQGEVEAATAAAREALDIRVRSLGARHPRTADSYTTLGVLAREKGRTDEAENYHTQALQIRRDHYGQDHAYVAESLRNMALTLHGAGRLAEARTYYEQALDMQVRVLGPQHPRLGPTRNSYGALLRALGEGEAALEQYRLVIDMQREAFGGEHPRLANSLTNAAVVVRDLGDLDEALRLAREGLAMRLRLLGEDNPSTAQSYNIIGILTRQMKRLDEAEDALQRADRIYRNRFGAEHPSVGINTAALGFVALDRGDLALAEQRFTAALEVMERNGAMDQLDAARAAFGLGLTLVALNRPAEAGAWFNHTLRVREASLPADHPEIAEARAELARHPVPALTAGG